MREIIKRSDGSIAVDRTIRKEVGGPDTWSVVDNCIVAPVTEVITNNLKGLTSRSSLPPRTLYHRKGGKDITSLKGKQLAIAREMCRAQHNYVVVDGCTLNLVVCRKEGRASVCVYDTDYIGDFSAALSPVAVVRAEDDPSYAGKPPVSDAILCAAEKMIAKARPRLKKGTIICQEGSDLAKLAEMGGGQINGYIVEVVD